MSWISSFWAWNKTEGYWPILVLIPTFIWGVLLEYLDVGWDKKLVTLFSAMVSGLFVYFLVLRVRSGKWDRQTIPSLVGIGILALLMPVICLIWNAVAASGGTQNAAKQKAALQGGVLPHSTFDLQQKVLVKGSFGWLPKNKVPLTFKLDTKTGLYEPEWLFGAIVPPNTQDVIYDIDGYKYGFLVYLKRLVKKKVIEADLYYPESELQIGQAEVHYVGVKNQDPAYYTPEINTGLTVKQCIDIATRKPLSYLLGRGDVKAHDSIIITIPQGIGLRDMCLAPSRPAIFARIGDDKAEVSPRLLIPLEGFRLTLDPKADLKMLVAKTWPAEMFGSETELSNSVQERAIRILKVKGVTLPFKEIPWAGLYYRIGNQPPRPLAEAVWLSGHEIAGKTIRIGLNLHGVPKGVVDPISLYESAQVHIALTAFQR